MKKEVKELKKTTRKQLRGLNLYLSIYSHLKKGLRPSQISKKLSISKQRLNYYLSTLKRKGFIEKIGYGVWKIIKEFEVKELKKITLVGRQSKRIKSKTFEEIKPDKVRGHAFMFKLKLPFPIKGWSKREEIFKQINFKFKSIELGTANGQRIVFKGKKIHLFDKSIIIYEKSSYMADDAQKAKNYALNDFMLIVRALERKLKANFSTFGKYKFKVSRQHYALVKNALAKQYNKEGKKLEVYNEKGLWFLIDNSYNLHEAETVHPKTAVPDNIKVQDFFNGVQKLEGYTPQFVTTAIAQNTINLKNYAVHLKAHVDSVKQLGKGVKELVKTIKRMNK